MSEQNKAIVRRYIEEAWNKGNLDLIDELYAEDYINHDASNVDPTQGPQGIRNFVSFYRQAFPDSHITIEDEVAEGDKVVVRYTARGTHKGDLMGIPPTDSSVSVTGTFICVVRDGKIREGWSNYDMLGVLQQIGAI